MWFTVSGRPHRIPLLVVGSSLLRWLGLPPPVVGSSLQMAGVDRENEFPDACLTHPFFVRQYCGCQIYCDAEVSGVTLQKALKPKKCPWIREMAFISRPCHLLSQ